MTRIAALAIAFAFTTVSVSPAIAAPCRDSKGKFIKCPPAKPAAPVRCKDAHGKFAKCGTPGTHRI